MAITRCPYCHAIIDENDKYCNNCGTQLLFSEDEEIEEEIPGEKIIEADTEEKDYTIDEPEGEKRPAPAKDLDSEIDEDLEQELREGTEELALDELVTAEAEGAKDDVTEEVILVDEIALTEAKDNIGEEELADELEEEVEEEVKKEAQTEEKPAEEEETKVYAAAALRKVAQAEPIADEAAPAEKEPDIEYILETVPPDEVSTAGESALRPVTFDTKELEGIGRTVELSKEKVDKFIEVLAEKSPETPAVPETTEKPPTGEPATSSLPPWASTMKGAPVFLEDTGPVETRKLGSGEPTASDTDEEVEIFPRRRDSDSTIGLPERVSQAPLPFEPGTAEEEEGEEEAREDLTPDGIAPPAESARPVRPAVLPVRGPETRELARHEIETAEEGEEVGPRPPFSFSVFFKSKAFDLLFVGLFWLVALWLAASSMGMTLFEILGAMSGSMLLLYGVFVLLYFFLFKFFLGETLGDRLFRPRE